MKDQPDEMSPSDNTTMTRVLEQLGESGWTGQLTAVAEGSVQCTHCRAVFPAGDLDIEAERRLEGASDPDDMSLVIAARCPACGTPSTLVLGYGPAGSDVDGDVVVALQRDGIPTSRASHVASATPEANLESPGATLDSPTVAEPNEPA